MYIHTPKIQKQKIYVSSGKSRPEPRKSLIILHPCLIPTFGFDSPKIIKSRSERNSFETPKEEEICHEFSNNCSNESSLDFTSKCLVFEKPFSKVKR